MEILILIGIIFLFCNLFKKNSEEVKEDFPHDMEQVKQCIDRAYALREKLEKLDNMIIDVELTKCGEPQILKNITMQYLRADGKNAEVSVMLDGGKTTEKFLEMLYSERDDVCSSLFEEIEKIPERQRQNVDKTLEKFALSVDTSTKNSRQNIDKSCEEV